MNKIQEYFKSLREIKKIIKESTGYLLDGEDIIDYRINYWKIDKDPIFDRDIIYVIDDIYDTKEKAIKAFEDKKRLEFDINTHINQPEQKYIGNYDNYTIVVITDFGLNEILILNKLYQL